MTGTFTPWTLDEITGWLFAREGSVYLKDGVPVVELPESNCDRYGLRVRREKLLSEILPHLRARRAEIVAMLTRSKSSAKDSRIAPEDVEVVELVREEERRRKPLAAEERARRKQSDAEESRRNIIAQLRKVAHDSGKDLWWIVLLPKYKTAGDGLTTIPDTAVYAAVEGSSEWVKLPKIVPDPEKKRYKPKRKKWKWTGG